MHQVLRTEHKYILTVSEAERLSFCLSQVMREDPHNGPYGYKIRSLYFDTPFEEDFGDQQAGLNLRRKLRLRIYDPCASEAWLELKQKQGSQQKKRSLSIPKQTAIQLSHGVYTPLQQEANPFAAELYTMMQYRCYRPKTIVEYQRKAFIAQENQTRITFDHHISASESCMDLFSPHLNLNPVLPQSYVVLEVKYNGFLLRYLKDTIGCVNKSEVSLSKYVLARQHGCLTRF